MSTLREQLEQLPRDALLPAGWVLDRLADPPAPPKRDNGGPDDLLRVREAAERLNVSRRWLYDHADKLPFTKRLTTGALRFSARGLERWKATR